MIVQILLYERRQSPDITDAIYETAAMPCIGSRPGTIYIGCQIDQMVFGTWPKIVRDQQQQETNDSTLEEKQQTTMTYCTPPHLVRAIEPGLKSLRRARPTIRNKQRGRV